MLYLAVLLVMLIEVMLQENDLGFFKQEMTRKVEEIANVYRTSYEHRCERRFTNCQVLSYHSCEGTSHRECYTDFADIPSCPTAGWFLGNESVVILPPTKEKDRLAEEDMQKVCILGGIDRKLKELDYGRDKQYLWEYVGDSSGFTKLYPSYLR